MSPVNPIGVMNSERAQLRLMTLDNTKVIFCLIILFGSNINSNTNNNQPTGLDPRDHAHHEEGRRLDQA